MVMFMSIVHFFSVRKIWRERWISFSLPVVGFIFDISIMNSNLWSVTKNVLGVSVVSKEIECADRIVYGTRI